MAVYQIETGTCHGRGFSGSDPNGFLAKFYTYITTAAGSGGPAWYIHDDQSAIGTNPYIVVSDVSSPAANEYNTGKSGGAPKFIKIGLLTATAGQVNIGCYLWWNNSTHVGYGLYSGTYLETYDDADFAYDFRGGDQCMIIQTRLGTAWDTFVLDDFVGDNNLLEASTTIGTVQSGLSAGSNVVVQLDTGEATNFTDDNYYYIVDMNGHSWVNYTQCTNVNTGSDQITLNTIGQNFGAGSIVGSYPHRFYTMCNTTTASTSDINYINAKLKIPYISNTDATYAFHDQSGVIYGGCYYVVASNYLTQMAPDDNSNYAVQRPGIVEYLPENTSTTSYGNQNRGYGVMRNVYATALGTMAAGIDGRTISGSNFLYFQKASDLITSGQSTIALLFLDTESAS